MGTQTNIARQIREGGADHVVRQDNHPKLVDAIVLAQAGVGARLTPSSRNETSDSGHGRTEVRRCRAFDAVNRLHKAEQWLI